MATYLATSRSAYQRSAVLTASGAQLVVMLYDGAHRALSQAAAAMRARQVELAHSRLRGAEMIINHLNNTLDFEQGGDISTRLQSLYTFYLRHLNEARIKQDPERVERVDRWMLELRDSWAQIVARGEPARTV
jgi:flagellar protein FliS